MDNQEAVDNLNECLHCNQMAKRVALRALGRYPLPLSLSLSPPLPALPLLPQHIRDEAHKSLLAKHARSHNFQYLANKMSSWEGKGDTTDRKGKKETEITFRN